MDTKKSSRAYRNPVPTVDVIIEIKDARGKDGIILIRRKNPPHGWALPGGFVDYGESLEKAAVREAEEETSLRVELRYQLHTYSDPDRDPRQHTISTVFVAGAAGRPKARDDARDIGIFSREEIDFPLAFDHDRILDDYYAAGVRNGTAPDNRRKRRIQHDRP
ncbi:MAG: NUDIX hydrolase [Candidatus Aminicenantes bacterium]|nr:NUDIX hydrolase [Candidatus Aminicenantes bacterium]